MISLYAQGNRYPYVNSGTNSVNSGDVITLAPGTAAGTGHIGIALSAITASGGLGELSTGGYPEGVYTLAKNAGEAFTDGQILYWDAVNKWLTGTAGSLVRAGRSFGTAISAATTATLSLNR